MKLPRIFLCLIIRTTIGEYYHCTSCATVIRSSHPRSSYQDWVEMRHKTPHCMVKCIARCKDAVYNDLRRISSPRLSLSFSIQHRSLCYLLYRYYDL
ncbi:uncharacterized protein BDW47DRAFT_101335 [Aspergillus candidus]|uniref:Secreted protein n=1 Tax=Aspergillus candidus TaxID=41067 RepID=A0A2I2FIW2_ASPCN|nr:hypothetical protein BDW47DRAFT_101335 [Aspergillus candidus]PLB40566.1 hypothetical protein BDW47DRAFT_101335 [Aspergillus candidus]